MLVLVAVYCKLTVQNVKIPSFASTFLAVLIIPPDFPESSIIIAVQSKVRKSAMFILFQILDLRILDLIKSKGREKNEAVKPVK